MEVGQPVYIRSLDNRKGAENPLRETKITKVGRKYFEVTERWLGRYHIDTMFHDGGDHLSRYKAYLQVEDYGLEVELRQLRDKITTYFRFSKPMTIEQAREIVKILDI